MVEVMAMRDDKKIGALGQGQCLGMVERNAARSICLSVVVDHFLNLWGARQ